MFKQDGPRQSLINLIVVRGAVTRDQLQSKSVQELEKILDDSLLAEIRAEAAQSPAVLEAQQRVADAHAEHERMNREGQLVHIFRTPVLVNGKSSLAIDNQANRRIIGGWAHEDQGERISTAWFAKVLSEQPELASQLTWQSADILDPAKRRQAETAQVVEERRVFHDFCRENGYSECESSFQLAKSVLESFDQYTLAQAVQSNALRGLAPASPEELEQFRQEVYEERVEFLTNRATPAELRAAAKTESEQLSARFQRQAQMSQIKTRQQAEIGQHPTLPEFTSSGVKLDGAFFKNLADINLNLFRQYCSKYGFAAITARLNGIQ